MKIIMHTDHIKAFIAKVNLWGRTIREGNPASFHWLTKVLTDEPTGDRLQEDITKYLNDLAMEFYKYFPDINTGDACMTMTRDPFKCVADSIPEAILRRVLRTRE